ncbi:MAG: STAS domain-containing protein [Spirochaetales bacterium]|nr:STAS domain-containing protein [Spirochaetales bacterium]
MRIKVTENGSAVVLRLSGRLTLEEIPWLGKSIEEQSRPAVRTFILQMADVTDISSSGIGKLLQIKRDCEIKGRQLLLADISPVTEYVLDLARLTDMFDICKTEAEALLRAGIKTP